MTSAIPCCRNTAAAIRIWQNFIRPRSATRRCGRCLRRTGLPELTRRGAARRGLRAALTRARDDAAPDWAAVGAPVAALMEAIELRHPAPPPAAPGLAPKPAEIEARDPRLRRASAARRIGKNGFIPTYAAFNLIGDADMGGRELLMALTGLNSRGYKNSTLAVQSGARLHRAFAGPRADQPALERDRRADVAADADPPSLGLLRRVLHRGAAELCRDRAGVAGTDRRGRAARSPTWWISACGSARKKCARMTARRFNVITALAPLPHPRFSRFFAQIKQDLGFGIYVPDCDTTACSFSAATQAGSTDPILEQPLLDFYAATRSRSGANEPRVTVPLNDNIDYEGGVVTWIDNLSGERPFGNDLDPTLNLDILEVSFRNARDGNSRDAEAAGDRASHHRHSRSGWPQAARSPIRARISIICRSFIRAYFGRCYAAFIALPPAAQAVIDPDGAFAFHPRPGAGLCAGRTDRARDERVRRGAGADALWPSRRRTRNALRRRCTASSRTSAKAAGAARSRPMNGTR